MRYTVVVVVLCVIRDLAARFDKQLALPLAMIIYFLFVCMCV